MNPHNDRDENVKGLVVIGGGLIATTPAAAYAATTVVASPIYPKLVELARDVISENLDGSPAGKYSPIIDIGKGTPTATLDNLLNGLKEAGNIINKAKNRCAASRPVRPPGKRTDACH